MDAKAGLVGLGVGMMAFGGGAPGIALVAVPRVGIGVGIDF